MQVKPSGAGFPEIESESVELLSRSQPNKPILAHLNVRLENILVPSARDGRHAIRCDHQIVFRRVGVRISDFRLEDKRYAQPRRALLENLQESHTGDAAESVARRGQLLSLEKHVDVFPVAKSLCDGSVSISIGFLKAAHRFVRKHDSPSEGAVGAIAFHHRDLPGRVSHFH